MLTRRPGRTCEDPWRRDPAQHATHSIISRLGSSSAPDDSGAPPNGAPRATTVLRRRRSSAVPHWRAVPRSRPRPPVHRMRPVPRPPTSRVGVPGRPVLYGVALGHPTPTPRRLPHRLLTHHISPIGTGPLSTPAIHPVLSRSEGSSELRRNQIGRASCRERAWISVV